MIFRRKKYLIDTEFQVNTILIFVCISFAGSIAGLAIFNYFALKSLESLMWSSHINIHSTGELIRPLLIKTNIGGFLFISGVLFVSALLILKKTAGPLYRMSGDISHAAGGDLTVDVSLRQKDEFRDTAHELDSMIKSINTRFRAVSDQYVYVSGTVDKAVNAPSEENFSVAFSAIMKLEEELGMFNVSRR